MTPLVAWVNLPLALLIISAIIGIPMWMTFRRPDKPADHSGARAYLQARAALTRTGPQPPASIRTARLHAAASRIEVPGRRHAAAAGRGHRAGREHTRTPA